MKPQSALVLTHFKDGQPKTPHLDQLKRSNPNVSQHVIVEKDTQYKRYHWKNSDQMLRRWWQCNSSKVSGEVVAILEWDTLVEIEMPALPDEADLVGAMVLHEPVQDRGRWIAQKMSSPLWTPRHWFWWFQVPQLGLKPGQAAVGLVSFGFMLVRRHYLDLMCKPCWDRVFSLSIQNELRFPTVLACEEARISQMYLPNVKPHGNPLKPEPGIYHPVKSPRD